MNYIHTCILTFFVLLGTTGCSEKKKQRNMIEQQIAAWSGRQIQFPSAMTFTRYALDTVAFDTQASEYKLFVYTDSTGCTSCKLQLPKWKEMIAIATTWSIKQKQPHIQLSDLDQANVEAVAGTNSECPNGCVEGEQKGCFCHQWYGYYDEYKAPHKPVVG